MGLRALYSITLRSSFVLAVATTHIAAICCACSTKKVIESLVAHEIESPFVVEVRRVCAQAFQIAALVLLCACK